MAFGIIMSIVLVGATGCILGFFLSFMSEKFKVETNPKEEEVLAALPGNNCGGCGFPGCSGCAKAIANGEAPVDQCPVGGAPVAAEIAKIMGVEAEAKEPEVAFVRCNGTCENAKNKYEYSGVNSCSAMALVPGGGPKSCSFGCMGFGDCVEACQFDAIHIVDGISLVDPDACKGCGACAKACPRNIIEMIPKSSTEMVLCRNKNKGKAVMDVCSVGCIACGLCEKNCPSDAIHVVDNIAHIDQSKCTGCGTCVTKCPRKIIHIIGDAPAAEDDKAANATA